MPDGAVNVQLIDRPLLTLSVDGNSAKGRWHGFYMQGGAADARWDGGVLENEYVKESGVWKIARLQFFSQMAGAYESGWKNANATIPIIPYHFTPDQTGMPIPAPTGPAPKTDATLENLEHRIDLLNAHDQVRNLQNACGMYIDRKMWDDVTDLFTPDGVLAIGNVGIYEGPAHIRRALERDGPAGLKHGEVNEHPLFDTNITIAPDGRQAHAQGIEMGIHGDVGKAFAAWSISMFDNRFVKGDDGKWRIREMRLFPQFKSDYDLGWGKSRIIDPPPAAAHAPSGAVPADDAGYGVVPALPPHPVTWQTRFLPVRHESRRARTPAGATVRHRAGSPQWRQRGTDHRSAAQICVVHRLRRRLQSLLGLLANISTIIAGKPWRKFSRNGVPRKCPSPVSMSDATVSPGASSRQSRRPASALPITGSCSR